jgi:putative DNA modification/repair radical SAM protein
MKILKTLFTNICEYDCTYCEHRARRDVPRTSFRSEELASLFMKMVQRQNVEGIFLSSGITRRADTVMDRIIDTAEILRKRYRYRGYIHLKILPGADRAHVEAAMRWASRVSINLEAPNPERLRPLSVMKRFDENLERISWIHEIQKERSGEKFPGQITQFVVGPAGESDREILSASDHLYRNMNLRRAYYSAFHPIPDTPLEDRAAVPLLREHRLYQADWLLRFYGFTLEEVPFDPEGNLPLAADPKTAWALRHPEAFPVDILHADYETLLRVPGIGPVSAGRIVESRSNTLLRDLKDLRGIGVVAKRASPFILLGGKPL